MKNTNSKRDKQLHILIIVVVVGIIALIVFSVVGKKSTTIQGKTSNTETTVQLDNTSTEVDTTLVTGEYGENDTLILAYVQEVINEKVIKVTVNGENIDVAMIGIKVSDEQKNNEMNYLKELLQPNTEIWLQYDENTMNDEGQHLCYIWLSNKVNLYSYNVCKENMVQGLLISNDYAEPLDEYPNSRYEVDFNLMNE